MRGFYPVRAPPSPGTRMAMSADNTEFLREGYEALERGDLETFEALSRDRIGPEFEFHHVWDGRVFRGYEGTMEWLADARETWKDYKQEVDEIIDLGDDVLVVLAISAEGAGSGVPVAQEFAVLWTFDGETVVRARSFTSRAEALGAARSDE
jgi:ketosteroid isomerase-like protein